MEALFIYIIKSTSLMLMFYCAYYFLLRKETFFNSNRWFLLSGLIVSVILPLLTYTKVIWIDAAPDFNTNFQTAFVNDSNNESTDFNWTYFILGLYAFGLVIFAIKLAIDFYSLNAIIKGKKIKQQADFKFIDINENIAPFSYFDYIVYNSSLYTPSELESILEHEKVHSDQNHTLDVLISRIFSIIFWFNPIVWFYKKAITQNLEFIADSEAAKKLLDKKAYQYTLLKITTHENCVAITNHFYQSLIKKRIVMLNKNQSNRRNSWKYYAVIPALAAFVLLFQIEVIAKERPQIVKTNSGDIRSVDVYQIKKSTTDKELKELAGVLKKLHNIDLEVSKVKRNALNELTSIKVDLINGNQTTQSIQTGKKEAIKDFGIVIVTGKNGARRAGIKTYDEKIAVSKNLTVTDKENNTIEIKNTTTNSQTNVNVNSNTSTKTNSDTNSNTSNTVIVNSDNNTKVITTDKGSNIVVSNGTKAKIKANAPLVIVNGEEMPSGFDIESIPNDNIESVNVWKGDHATAKYGNKAANGAIEIETKN